MSDISWIREYAADMIEAGIEELDIVLPDGTRRHLKLSEHAFNIHNDRPRSDPEPAVSPADPKKEALERKRAYYFDVLNQTLSDDELSLYPDDPFSRT